MKETAEETSARVKREIARFPGAILAFVAIHSTVSTQAGNYEVGIAELGRGGYSLPLVRMFFHDYDKATDAAHELNGLLGLSERSATLIVAETMSRSRFEAQQREEEAGYSFFTVKLLLGNSDAEEPIHMIEEALEDFAFVEVVAT